MNGEIRSYLNQHGKTIEEFPIEAKKIAELIELIDGGFVSNTVAGQKIFPALLETPNGSAKKIAEDLNLIQDSDEDSISAVIKEVIKQHPVEAEQIGRASCRERV